MRQAPRWRSQLEQGAPADIFASADLEWMDYSAGKKTIKDDTRVNLLGNRLVLIAPKDSKIDTVAIAPGLRSREADRRRPHRDRRGEFGAGRQIRQERAGEARHLGLGREEVRDGRQRARRAGAGRARRSGARHRVRDRRQGGEEREDRRRLPGGLASRRSSIRSPPPRTPSPRPRRIWRSCAAASPRRCSSNTASRFLVRPTS